MKEPNPLMIVAILAQFGMIYIALAMVFPGLPHWRYGLASIALVMLIKLVLCELVHELVSIAQKVTEIYDALHD